MTMRLNEVRLHNFGPYYGDQHLRFGRSLPVVLVHAPNGSGKTSLLNGIRWALYGRVVDRPGRVVPRARLINRQAASAGTWNMSVEVTLEVDGELFDLTRAIQPKVPTITPRTDSDFEEKLFLRRSGRILSEDEVQREINRILPEQISQFFLFDGELLNAYERLLDAPDNQSKLLQESIEHILGVPALSHGIADLRQNLKDAERRQEALARKDQRAHVYATQAATIAAEIDKLEADLDRLRGEQDNLTIQQRELDETLKEYTGIESDVQFLQDFNERLDKLTKQQNQLQADHRAKLAHAWRDFLQPCVNQRLAAVEEERDRQIANLKRAATIQGQIDELERAAADAVCPLCSQQIVGERSVDLGVRQTQLRQELQDLHFDEKRLQQASQDSRKLRQVGPAGVMDSIASIERNMRQGAVDHSDLSLKIEDINDRLRGVDQAAVVRNRTKFQQVTEDLGALKKTIAEVERDIGGKQAHSDSVRANISKVSGPAMDRLNREVEIYQELARLFERAKERLRDELRRGVEQDANEIFREISTDPTYSLKINDHYGLRMIDANGHEVRDRSAGFEQVVALSLIGALNRRAVRKGPIIMDTPFGRLDPGHRENVLRFLPRMADQVALLVHGGEVSRERDLGPIMDKVDREYRIERITQIRSELMAIDEERL